MYFKKLEILGFKSFADKTLLQFEPGITAVVGPNGCGKSNIFDAVRWVLGEQSIKELRGSSREDVIFNGTDKRPALGMAEVHVTFSNTSRQLPIEYDEVTVSRRLYRSGESEYLLNKTVVRLKDIQELLMGTGIGAESYSLVQQGKVDSVVSARPEERRQILDEASGITKYKRKKKEALNKLRGTEDNLLRVNDITVEVRRQISSIERQASKARRYREVFDRLRLADVALARRELEQFQKDFEQIRETGEGLTEHKAGLQNEIEEVQQLIESQVIQLEEAEDRLSEKRQESVKADGDIELQTRQIQFNEERLQNLESSHRNLLERKQALTGQCGEQQKRVEEIDSGLNELNESLAGRVRDLDAKRPLLSGMEESIRESKERIEGHESRIADLKAAQDEMRQRLTELVKQAQDALSREDHIRDSIRHRDEKRADVEARLHNANHQLESEQTAIRNLGGRKDEAVTKMTEIKLSLSKIEQQKDESERRRLFLISQKEFIEKLHTQYKDIPDPVIEGRFFSQSAPEEHHDGVIGKVKSYRPVEIEQAPFLKEHVALNPDQPLYEITCETKFIELDPRQVSTKIEEIAARVSELEQEKNLWIERFREQENTIRSIESEIHDKEKSLSVAASKRQDQEQELAAIAEEKEKDLRRLDDVIASREDIRSREEESRLSLESAAGEEHSLQEEIRETRQVIVDKTREKEELNLAIARMEGEIESVNDKLQSRLETRTHLSENLERWSREIHQIDEELGQYTSRREDFGRESESIQCAIEDCRKRKEAVLIEIEEAEAVKSDLAQRVNSHRTRLKSLEKELHQCEDTAHKLEMNSHDLTSRRQLLVERFQQTYRMDVEVSLGYKEPPAEEDSVSGEADAVAATDHSEAPVEGASGEGVLQVTPENNDASLEEGASPVVPESHEEGGGVKADVWLYCEDEDPYLEMSTPDLRTEVKSLKKKCDSYGTVNLVAIEEFDELKDRFEFLTRQQSDLLEAKSQLMSTVNKINRETKQMFLETFEKVSEQFRNHFRLLFGGGEAKLVLLDPENVLESGIEIIARPPGKKLTTIGLLSGGERTMAAIALIFGVFKVNPSPFCVLDEIDAALDEANVGRFSMMLKEFANTAQFIVITHNKKTISSADVLYGITMPETGISRVVSVKLTEDAEKLIDGAPRPRPRASTEPAVVSQTA